MPISTVAGGFRQAGGQSMIPEQYRSSVAQALIDAPLPSSGGPSAMESFGNMAMQISQAYQQRKMQDERKEEESARMQEILGQFSPDAADYTALIGDDTKPKPINREEYGQSQQRLRQMARSLFYGN